MDLPKTRQGFAWLTAALVLFISWQAFSPRGVSIDVKHADKALHVAAFATLAISSTLASSRNAPLSTGACLALLAFGAFIEVVQSFIPLRQASWLDVLADSAGIAAGRLGGGLAQAALRKII